MDRQFSAHPDYPFAMSLLQTLQAADFVAYFAGGCVRDALLGHVPKDFDIATNATPEAVRRLFGKRRTLAIGASFGVINVLPPHGVQAGPVEVATFRSDGSYSDGRRPDSVKYGDPQADAQRRDFTINGLFFDAIHERVIDYVEGHADLQAKIVRAIGKADDRIAEDKLRMLRAVRFATLPGFSFDPMTLNAVRRYASQIILVSSERIGAELRQMLASRQAAVAMQLLATTDLASHLMPMEVVAVLESSQTERWLDARADPDLPTGLAILLALATDAHDFIQQKRLLNQLANNWRLSKQERDATAEALLSYRLIMEADRLPWSQVQPILIGRHVRAALTVAAAHVHASDHSADGIQFARQRLAWSPERLNPEPLIDGDLLRDLGMTPGPDFRRLLASARQAQLDGQVTTTKQAIELVRMLAAEE